MRSRVTSAISSSWLGQELVQRRVDEADDHRQAVHGAEEAREVIGLEALELAEGGIERLDRLALLRRALVIGPGLRGRGRMGIEDHSPDGRQAILLEEHVLGPAEADPLRAERPRALASRG